MSAWSDSEDRVAIVQMNTELRHAQLELRSAQCATDRLRLRFSIEDIARHAQPDVLQKARGTATALHHYYSSIEKQRSILSPIPEAKDLQVNEAQILEAVARVSGYLRQQRDLYFPGGKPLSGKDKTAMQPFFPFGLLASVRTVELKGRRMPNPPFYPEAKAMGVNLPEFTHMSSVTFENVIVFNETIGDRALFHGLVHAVQCQILGLERYADGFVRGLIGRDSHVNVPLEAHAITLESKFVAGDPKTFSVEEQVWLWINQGRYSQS